MPLAILRVEYQTGRLMAAAELRQLVQVLPLPTVPEGETDQFGAQRRLAMARLFYGRINDSLGLIIKDVPSAEILAQLGGVHAPLIATPSDLASQLLGIGKTRLHSARNGQRDAITETLYHIDLLEQASTDIADNTAGQATDWVQLRRSSSALSVLWLLREVTNHYARHNMGATLGLIQRLYLGSDRRAVLTPGIGGHNLMGRFLDPY